MASSVDFEAGVAAGVNEGEAAPEANPPETLGLPVGLPWRDSAIWVSVAGRVSVGTTCSETSVWCFFSKKNLNSKGLGVGNQSQTQSVTSKEWKI